MMHVRVSFAWMQPLYNTDFCADLLLVDLSGLLLTSTLHYGR